MTSINGNNSDRLDRIERLLESVAQRTDSNARTIQGILDARAEERLKREEEKVEHEEKMAVMSDAIQRLIRIEEAQNRMLASMDDDRPTVLRRLMSIENKVDTLIERNQ
jgi:hypothetical protein